MSNNEKDVYNQSTPIDEPIAHVKKELDEFLDDFALEYQKYQLKEKEKLYSSNYEKIKRNLAHLQNEQELEKSYPFLYKLIKRRLHYLTTIIEYSRDKIVSRLARKQGNYYFYVSSRYLASLYSGGYNTWSRNISIFCTLGLMNKLKYDDTNNRTTERRALRETKALAKRMGIDHKKLSPINYYTIPIYNDELLTEANRRAGVLLDNNFRANGFSKFYLIRVFGQQFADTVFHDERYISEYSQYVQSKIEEFILKDIQRHGYTTKDRILRYVQIDYNQLQPWEYGFKREKQNKKAILSREFDRSISEIKDKYNLEYKKANKELKERFKLATSKTIIYANENNL
ncbi:hypothetical protein ACE198_06730 [Neobacillus sp. KR4-4]|uniref:hypothetical protein n=1 Tax=Neobacillus sp. KR4-4 TaxID=3344872 RepID=UPI0035CB6C18